MTTTKNIKSSIDFDEIEASLNAQFDTEQLRIAKLEGQISGFQAEHQKSLTNLNKLQGAFTLLNQMRKAAKVVEVASVEEAASKEGKDSKKKD